MIGSWRPIYFAQMYLYTRPADAAANQRNAYLGQLRFRAGWYLETTVDMDGVTRKVGIVDGNCNFRLGDLNQPITYQNDTETNWYFQGGDNFLVDNDGSGKFENSIGEQRIGSVRTGALSWRETLQRRSGRRRQIARHGTVDRAAGGTGVATAWRTGERHPGGVGKPHPANGNCFSPALKTEKPKCRPAITGFTPAPSKPKRRPARL